MDGNVRNVERDFIPIFKKQMVKIWRVLNVVLKFLLELQGTTFLFNWQPPLSCVCHMSTSHTIRAYAQAVWDESDKD